MGEFIEIGINGEFEPFIKKESEIKEYINKCDEIIKTYNTNHQKIANKLRRIIEPKNYKKDGPEIPLELYARYKPKKELIYEMWAERIKQICPWHKEKVSNGIRYEISRKLTDEEESDFGSEMTLLALKSTYEERILTKNEKKELNKIQNELKKLDSKKRPTIATHFTDLLPHLIEKHHFFPHPKEYFFGIRDLEFLLSALGFEKYVRDRH